MNNQVLYIEDNQLNIRLVQKSLHNLPIDLNIAFDGDEALRWLEHNTPNLILLDINLPTVSGIDVLMKLKLNKKTRHIPVIALTADNSLQTRKLCEMYGASGFLEKPISRHTLIQTIQTHLPIVAYA